VHDPPAGDKRRHLVGRLRAAGQPPKLPATGRSAWHHGVDQLSRRVGDGRDPIVGEAALERGSGGVYNVTDDEPAPVSEWLPYLAEAVGVKAPMRVPTWLASLIAGSVAVRWMTEGRGSSNANAKRELGWRPRWSSWRQGFREGLAEPAPRPRQVAA
jgi:hypothetical protein